MEYLYYLENASLTLRIVEYLHNRPYIPIKFITVINQIDGWVVKIKMKWSFNLQQNGDFRAFLNELGTPYEPSKRINATLLSLESGHSAIDVMHCYQVVVVSHGNPNQEEIKAFQQQFIKGMGYCPKHLA